MTEKNDNRFEILALIAQAGITGEDLSGAIKTALEMASGYVSLEASALYMWDDKNEITLAVSFSSDDKFNAILTDLEQNLFSQLRSERQLMSAYLSFGGDIPTHSFTMPLNFKGNIFGAVIGLQAGERSIIAEEKFLESFSAMLTLTLIAHNQIGASGADEKTIEQEKLKSILDTAVTVNHEVNNPLTAILGNVQLLLMNKEGMEPDLEKKLKTIEESALKIRDVTQRLMKLTSPRTVEYNNGTKMVDIYGEDEDEQKES